MQILKQLLVLSLFIFLASCGHTPQSLRLRADEFMTAQHGFSKELVRGGKFVVTTYQKIQDKSSPITFYVEGDGHTFESYGMPALNPTPYGMLTMNLSVRDGARNVVYIARPCQFTPMEMNPACNEFYWIRGRMSKETVISLAEVINKIAGKSKIHLVGFSGGGGMVVLMSALGLVKPQSIITVAGNLDHIAFTQHHTKRISATIIPMSGSLNPIDFAGKIAHIPQLHLSGGDDIIVPAHIAQGFAGAAKSSCTQRRVFDDATHSKNWQERWQEILQIPVTCN